MSSLLGAAIAMYRLKRKMEKLGAVSEESAKTPKELGEPEWALKHGMAHVYGVRRTEDGRYYLERKDRK
jgi:hypothetical protein